MNVSIEEYRQLVGIDAPPKASQPSKIAEIASDIDELSNDEKKIDSSENKRPAKYRNKKCVFRGEVFDSVGELKRWCELLLLQRSGEIQELQRQVRFTVFEGDTYQKSIHWIPDFRYIKDDEFCVEDFKSPVTEKKQEFRMKVKLFKKLNPKYSVYVSTKKGVKQWK